MAGLLERLKGLNDERVSAVTEARSILDKAKVENRSTSGEERATVQRAFARVDAIDGMITKAREDDADGEIESRSAENTGRLRTPNSSRELDEGDKALASFLSGESRSVDIDLMGVHQTRGQRAESRALNVGTSTAGGNTVPEGFRAMLYDYRELLSGVRHTNPDILMTASGEDIPMPLVNSRGTAAIVSEAGTIAGTDPTFTQKTLKAIKYGQIINISHELMMDNGVNLESWIAKDMGNAMTRAMDDHYVNGNGTSQPEGILTQAALGITGGTAVASGANQRTLGHPTADEIIDLVHELDYGYRMNPGLCYFMLHPNTMRTIRQFKGSDGQYLWQPSLIPGNPDMLLGFPIVQQPHMPELGSGTKSILFGSFNDALVIRDISSVRLERSTEHKFGTDEVSFRCLMRTDSRVRNTDAVKYFVGGTA